MTSADTFTMAVDVIDQAVPLVATQATHAIRHERAKVVASTQGSYDAMFAPDVQGISLTERLLVALYACRLSNSGRLADHYQQRLVQDGADLGLVEAINMNTLSRVPAGRMQTILRFTSKLIECRSTATAKPWRNWWPSACLPPPLLP